MIKTKMVPVTMHALMQRLQRRVAIEGLRLYKSRDGRGRYYMVNVLGGSVVRQNIDPEKLARELDVLRPWEEVV